MNRTTITQSILEHKLVAIIRLKEPQHIAPLIDVLVQNGIRVLEITSNTPNYLEEIKKARSLYPNTIIGAGTVTNTEITRVSIKSGAQFLVTPNTNPAIVKIAHENNIPVLMGALTPTEIVNATEAQADIVKLFPAGNMGTGYYKSIKGPLSNTKFIAVGGINLSNAKAWIDSGIDGLGIGSSFSQPIHTKEDEVAIKNKIHQVLEIINPT